MACSNKENCLDSVEEFGQKFGTGKIIFLFSPEIVIKVQFKSFRAHSKTFVPVTVRRSKGKGEVFEGVQELSFLRLIRGEILRNLTQNSNAQAAKVVSAKNPFYLLLTAH